MTRWPEGLQGVVPLPLSFGGEGLRGRWEGKPVIVLSWGESSESGFNYADLARRWDTWRPQNSSLAASVRWFFDGPAFFWILDDPGGPLLSELFENPRGWPLFEGSLDRLMDQWEALVGLGATWLAFDPHRWILGPEGLVSCDLIHVAASRTSAPQPSFVAPEDIRVLSPEMTSRTSLGVDLRSGMFSLGTLLYRFLTGRWPGEKSDVMESLHALLNLEPDFPASVWEPWGLVIRSVVQKTLQKNPDERYQTLRGLKWDLGQRHQTARTFVPGVHDRPQAISEIRRVYGRDSELQEWAASLESLRSGRPVALVLRGAGGQGKSRLIEDFRRRSEPDGVLWLQGKFDQFDPQFTTGAVAQILRQWVDDDDFASEGRRSWAETLRKQLGRQLRVLTAMIPALEAVLGPGPELVPLNPEDNLQRLLQTLLLFWGLVSAVRPVVLAVEDVHWADDLSLKILEALVAARIPRLALVATSRPSVAPGVAGFLELVGRETSPGHGLKDLTPLDDQTVEAILADCTGLHQDDRRSLARVLSRVAQGNPFAIRVLVREVNLRQAAEFDPLVGRWVLHLDRLRDLPQDQALSLVSKRLESLEPDARRAVLVAALMGVQFSQEDVIDAGGVSESLFDQIREELFQLGVWEPAPRGEYRFGHDRIQQEAYESAPEDERSEAHLRLGRMRLARRRRGLPVPPASIAPHLNRCLKPLSDEEKAELLVLNMEAGEAAREANDTAGSLRFYQEAITQGGGEVWRSPDLGWRLYKGAAEVAYTEFRRDLADRWCDEVVRWVGSPLRRAQIRERQQNYLFFHGDLEGSIHAGIAGLKELGVSISQTPSMLQVFGTLARVKAALIGKSMESLVTQGENPHERSRTTQLLLSGFVPPAFHSGQQSLFGLAVLKATLLTLRDGVSRESAPAYMGYAVLLAALGDLRGAQDFGRLAMAINNRYDDLVWKSMVLTLTGLFCVGWFEPWSHLRPWFEAARQASEDSGDVVYLTYAQLFTTLWNPGEDLPQKRQRIEEALALILKNRFPLTRVSAEFALGRIRNLEATTGPSVTFATRDFDPVEGLAEYQQARSMSGLAVCYTDIVATSFLLGDLDRAVEALAEAEAHRSAIAGSLYEESLTLFAGLVQADLARRGDRSARRRLGALGRQARRWSRLSSTFEFHADLLQAEGWELAGKTLAAQKKYLSAVAAADRGGMFLHQGIARERASRFFWRLGHPGLARIFLGEALDSWRRYGATAKVALLEVEAAAGGLTVPAAAVAPSSVWDVDRVSLIRALKAISGDIQIQSLARTTTKLILENSGADRVALLVLLEGTLVLEGETSSSGYVSGDHRPFVALSDLPQGLIREAFLDRRMVIREEITGQDRRREPILVTRGVKSLIVLPLTSPDGVQGLVYLENTVMSGILTSARVRILELLSSTIGMAIQNARLFHEAQQTNENLERRVEERTRELRLSQKRIALQEKLASLGALTAGIAHELKNPINIINNFSESSIDLVDELRAHLETVHEQFPPKVREDVEYLVSELIQNMADIKKHGNRGNDIIRSMLMHTHSEAGSTTEEDLNALIQESLGLSYHGWNANHLNFDCSTETHFDPRLPRVTMIRGNFSRVLINVFNNAFQAVGQKLAHRPQGYRPRVVVSTHWLAPGIKIVVEDNGPGIPADIVEKVFQPFFTTKPPGEGTGLGLSISHEIIQEEFGGTFEVQSEVGEYARFIIVLPRAGEGG